jgi:hypothetical protein
MGNPLEDLLADLLDLHGLTTNLRMRDAREGRPHLIAAESDRLDVRCISIQETLSKTHTWPAWLDVRDLLNACLDFRMHSCSEETWHRIERYSVLLSTQVVNLSTVKAASFVTPSPDWKVPKLPERLFKFASVLIAAGGRMGSDDLSKSPNSGGIGFDPSRINQDFKNWTWWVKKYIGKEGRGVYCWLPLTASNVAPQPSHNSATKETQIDHNE